VQAQAIELGMLLTIPAAVALAVCAGPIATVIFEGGRFTAEDASVTGAVLATLVLGLPAYVLIKILAPGFYARRDVKTPVVIAVGTLIASVLLNFILVPRLGIVALPLSTAIGAWANALVLAGLLHARGHFRVPGLARLAAGSPDPRRRRHGGGVVGGRARARRALRRFGGRPDPGDGARWSRRAGSSISPSPGSSAR
jgi:putative peptidoglycan lipid II flippase